MEATLLKWNDAQFFYATLFIAAVLIRIPFVGVYFRTVNTLFHENGHALAAILLNGEVNRIELKNDTSGTALTKTPSKGKAMLVAFAGYPFATTCAVLFIWLAQQGHLKTGMLILFSISLINLMLFVRNTYGLAWLLTFTGLILLIHWLNLPWLNKVFLLGTGLVSFAEAVFSVLVLLYLGFARPRQSGDAAILARFSHLPAALWALLTAAVCGGIVWLAISHFFPAPAQLFQ